MPDLAMLGYLPNDSLKSLVDPTRDFLVFKRDPLNARQLSEAFSSFVELPAAPAGIEQPRRSPKETGVRLLERSLPARY